MSIKTSKRIALGVIASLVFAPFAAIAPASAAITAVSVGDATVTVTLGQTVAVPVNMTTTGTSDGTDALVITATITKPEISNMAMQTAVDGSEPESGKARFALLGETTADAGGDSWTSTASTNALAVADTGSETVVAGTYQVSTLKIRPDVVGTYTFTLTPVASSPDLLVANETPGTITVIAVSGATASLSASVSNAASDSINRIGTDNPVITVARPTGGTTADGEIALRVVSSANATDLPIGSYIGAGATRTGVTIGTDSAAGRAFTFSTGTFDTAGTYAFTAFVDANANGMLDSSESSVDVSFLLAGAPETITISRDLSTVPSAGATVTFIVSVSDEDGNATKAASGEITFAVTGKDSAGDAIASGTVATRVTGIAAAIQNWTRIGTTNQYRDAGAYSGGAVGDVYTLTGTVVASEEEATSSFTVLNDTSTAITSLSLGNQTGLYFGTAGAAGWTTNIPASLPNSNPATANVAVSADVSVTSLTFTLKGTATKAYAVSSVLSGTSDTSRISVPTTVTTLADGTVIFTVTNSAPKASATTGSDVLQITISDAASDDVRYTVTWRPVTAVWTLSPATSFDVLEKSSNTVTATLTDNFARVLGGVAYTVQVAGRNVSASSGVTSATGTATYTVNDTATTSYATVGGFPSDTVTFANVATTAIPAATKAVTFSYKATLAAVGTVTVTVASGDVTIDEVEATPGLPASASRATYTATVRTAAGATVAAGTLVTFAGGADDLFLNGISSGVTNALGQASVTVYRQKVGSAVITATANGVTGSAVAKKWINNIGTVVPAGTSGTDSTSARNVTVSAAQTIVPGSAATVVATVTDRWGNPVQGHKVTFSYSGVGRPVAGATTVAGTDVNGNAQFQVTSLSTEAGVMTVRATIAGARTADLAGFVAGTAVAGVTAGNSTTTSTVTFAAAPTPEVVIPPVEPTLTGSLNGRILLFGSCMADEGDMIIYIKTPGGQWREKAKTLECVAGEFDGSLRAPKAFPKFYRVKQEGTGLWSPSVLIRR